MFQKLMIAMLLPFFATCVLNAQEPVQPSPEHKVLTNDVGTWDADMSLYVNGPEAEPVKARAVETNKMMGQFWLVSHLEYEMFGQKMFGSGQFGFDPTTGKFVGTWIDTASPYISHLDGVWDEREQTWTYIMSGRDELGNPTKGKLITKIVDKDHKTFEMHMAIPNSRDRYFKVMDVNYTRRK